jgi:hypothetical protein
MRSIFFIVMFCFSHGLFFGQDCMNYVLHFQSNVTAGGPSGLFYNISAANLSIGNGTVQFDSDHTEHWDTLCMTAGCSLIITIDVAGASQMDAFDFQVFAFGMPLQLTTYDVNGSVINAAFCSTITCPNQIQSQMIDCDSYDFYVPAYVGNVSWDFGDNSSYPIGAYQQHAYAQDGLFNVIAMVDAAGCGPEYSLVLPVNVDCSTTQLCPTQMVLDTLTCQEYYIHFDTPAPGSVDWEVDGFSFSTPTAEMTYFLPNGFHTITAIYYPTGWEGCTLGGCSDCPITFYDTVTVACEVCQPVFMGFTSVPDLGGTEMLFYSITNEDGDVVNEGQVNFTANQPVFDFYDCWMDGCYYLDICSEGAVADSNFIVDVIEPLVIISNEQYTTGVCNGRLLQLGFNSDCQNLPIDTCSGAWLSWSTTATYLTVPPVFNPDTLIWSVVDGLGNELGNGVHIVTDEFPEWQDSLCLSTPLTCYQMNLSLNDTITGLTYLDYSLSANDIDYNGFLNVVQNEVFADFNFQPGVNCFGTGVNEVMQEKIKVYPNPAQDHITVDFPLNDKNQTIQIFNGLGQKVLESTKFTRDKNVLDISTLVNGIYTIVVGQESIRLAVTK